MGRLRLSLPPVVKQDSGFIPSDRPLLETEVMVMIRPNLPKKSLWTAFGPSGGWVPGRDSNRSEAKERRQTLGAVGDGVLGRRYPDPCRIRVVVGSALPASAQALARRRAGP
jgi:hypothetical protein